jgi:hypothetical protein
VARPIGRLLISRTDIEFDADGIAQRNLPYMIERQEFRDVSTFRTPSGACGANRLMHAGRRSVVRASQSAASAACLAIAALAGQAAAHAQAYCDPR